VNASDKPKFAKIVFGLGEYYRTTVSPSVTEIYWRVLQGYDLNAIEKAVTSILSNPDSSPFMPKANEIIAAMPLDSGSQWLSADEAWAHVIAAHDEKSTVVFPSDEAQKAWHQAAEPLFKQNDQNPARMAFRGAYDRLVSESKSRGIRPKAKLIPGSDPTQRVEVAQKYIALGVLKADDVPEYIALAAPEITAEGRAIAGLLGFDCPPPDALPDDFREKYAKLKAAIKTTKTPAEIRADMEAIRRSDIDKRKADTLEALRGMA